MGYKIDYSDTERESKNMRVPVRWLTAIGLVLLALMLNICWYAGSGILQSLFLPDEAAVTTAALETMAQELRQGVSVGEALRDFCLQVLAK